MTLASDAGSGFTEDVNIPAGRTIIGWEQTKSPGSGFLKGFFVYLDNGVVQQSGEMGTATDGPEYFPGPITGLRYKYGTHIESLNFKNDVCYCDFTSTPSSVSTLMGTPVSTTFS